MDGCTMELDGFDKKILRLLQQDNKISQRELATQVNLSASAVNRRIAALEADGYIKGNIAIVDNKKIGKPITLIVEVRIKNKQSAAMDHHKSVFLSTPSIQQVYIVTGDFDFLLIMTVADMSEYEVISEKLLFNDENIHGFKTMVTLQNIKQSFEVSIE